MAESSVNNIDGVPFWGHGTEENLLAGITPQDETEESIPENDEDEGENDEGTSPVEEEEGVE